jgi:DNA-binding response OmpR family regulator
VLILVVEDERRIASFLEKGLIAEGVLPTKSDSRYAACRVL